MKPPARRNNAPGHASLARPMVSWVPRCGVRGLVARVSCVVPLARCLEASYVLFQYGFGCGSCLMLSGCPAPVSCGTYGLVLVRCCRVLFQGRPLLRNRTEWLGRYRFADDGMAAAGVTGAIRAHLIAPAVAVAIRDELDTADVVDVSVAKRVSAPLGECHPPSSKELGRCWPRAVSTAVTRRYGIWTAYVFCLRHWVAQPVPRQSNPQAGLEGQIMTAVCLRSSLNNALSAKQNYIAASVNPIVVPAALHSARSRHLLGNPERHLPTLAERDVAAGSVRRVVAGERGIFSFGRYRSPGAAASSRRLGAARSRHPENIAGKHVAGLASAVPR